jgi:type II secretory pathway component GspD/PulD (secretin)
MFCDNLLFIIIICVVCYVNRNKPRPTGLRMAANLAIGLLAVSSVAYLYYPDVSDEAAETASLEITFKEQDARLLANQMRGFELGGLEFRIQSTDSETWIVSGAASDVRIVQSLARALDSTLVTSEHVIRAYEIEHHDARSLANATRGRAPEGLSVGIVVSPEGSWYVIVKQEDVEALESWLAEIDSPDLRITSEGVLEAV